MAFQTNDGGTEGRMIAAAAMRQSVKRRVALHPCAAHHASCASERRALGGVNVLAGALLAAAMFVMVSRPASAQDATPPQLTALSFPSTVDVSGGPATVTVEYGVSDDLAGASSFSIAFMPPGRNCGDSGAGAGESFSPVLSRSDQVQFTLSQFGSPIGTYPVCSLYVCDPFQCHTYNASDLTALGFPTQFVVTGTQDVTAPELTSLSFPSTVDVSRGPVTVTVNYGVTDDLSGATSFQIYFQGPGLGCGGANAYGSESFAATLSRSDSVAFTLGQYGTPPGSYPVCSLYVCDVLQCHSYTVSELQGLGFPAQFVVTGTQDVTAPQLTALSFPSTVDVSGGPATVTVEYGVSDDLAGASSFSIAFMPPGRNCGDSGAGAGESFSPVLSRSDQVQFTLSQFGSPIGTYPVCSLYVCDPFQCHTYNASDLTALGFPTQFVVSGTQDVTAPQLTALSFPATVDVSSGPVTFTVDFSATDDLSGFYRLGIRFARAGDSCGRGTYQYFGPATNVTSSLSFGLGQFDTPIGTYEVCELYVHDAVSNIRYYTVAELTALGFPTQFSVVDVAEACGNGVLQAGEQCDDGNTDNNDACKNGCSWNVCGDGVVRTGVEQCDDGNSSNNDGCKNDCTLNVCGDGALDLGVEQCDDGNSVDGDGCSAHCTTEITAPALFGRVATNLSMASLGGWSLCYRDSYGDGGTALSSILSQCTGQRLLLGCRQAGADTLLVAASAPREDVIFDTGTSNTPHVANQVGWYFNDSYSWGFAPAGEPISRNSCDTANSSADERVCWHTGGGNINPGYRCGSAVSFDTGYERLIFQATTLCGNGVGDPGEGCDDGNLLDGDGCDSNCVQEACGNGVVQVGEECDDGNTQNGDCCTSSCQAVPSGTGCTDDGSVCTNDQCDGAGVCLHTDTGLCIGEVLVPYLAASWKYQVVSTGQGAGFEQPGFDESGFSLGTGGFGEETTCDDACCVMNFSGLGQVGTNWPANTDILLLRRFSLPTGAANLRVSVAVDESVQVYVNGHDVSGGLRSRTGCAWQENFVFSVPNSLVSPGDNLLAVLGRNSASPSYLDVRVTLDAPACAANFSPPTAGAAGTSGVISGDPWTVCRADTATAWVAANSAGEYNGIQVCRSLGYTGVDAAGGTGGTVCGYVGGIGVEKYNYPPGFDPTHIALTVNWRCVCGVQGAAARCGDGYIDAGEQCDDGNTVSGDGCDSQCMTEAGWTCPADGGPCQPNATVTPTPTPIHTPTAPPAGDQCGNGVLDVGEECDTGGYCIGGANAGTHCTSEAPCGLSELGVCIGGLKREVACADDAACGAGGTCVRCVPAGNSPIGTTGQTCAANCTIETKIHTTLDPASNEMLYSELLGGTLALSLSGSQDVLVGKERNGEIPLAIIASSVRFDPINVGTIACACVRGVPVQTCGGTLFEADGVTPTLDCTDQYTAGASVCTNAGKPPCAYVNGPGNSASGVIGCSGLTGVNALFSQDSKGSADPAVCDPTSYSFNPPNPPYPVCGDSPVITLSGSGGAGSAIVINTTAIGQYVGGDCSAAPANFCTDSAPISQRGTPQTLPAVSGVAAGFITNANQTNSDTICNCNGGAIACLPADCHGGSPQAGPIAINGSTVSCSQVASGSLAGLGLAGTFTQLSSGIMGDIVVTNLQKVLQDAGSTTPTATPTGATRTPTATSTITSSPTPALPAGAQCGNGVVDVGEECDTGGFCIGGANAGTHCTSEAQCGLSELGVCIGGVRPEVACANDAACGDGGKCVRCVTFGNSTIPGDATHTCAANCMFETNCRGDCNGDGVVSAEEVITCVGIMQGDQPVAACQACDANGDSQVTIDEVRFAVENSAHGCPGAPRTPPTPVAGPCVGDCSGNNQVELEEIITCSEIALGDRDMSICQACDLNADGQVTADEVAIQIDNYATGCFSGAAATSTPTPTPTDTTTISATATPTPTPTITPATPVCVLDVDGSGRPAKVATDVVYIARRLLGFVPVPPSFRAAQPSIPSDVVIAANIDAANPSLDVDQRGGTQVATDIVYIARRLLGFSPVPPNFRTADPTIPSDAEIAARIDALCP